jgi:hypothetical protein
VTLPAWVGPQYALAPRQRRHHPPASRPFEEYRDCVRLEFALTCVYCLSTEAEVAPGARYGGFEIEHFKPKGLHAFRRFRNVYSNLLWACRECNLAKGDYWPTTAELARGERFVDPCTEPLGQHLTLTLDSVEAVAGSAAGPFMITEIRLNSALHIRRRRERDKRAQAFALAEAQHHLLAAEVARNGGTLDQLSRLADQRKILDDLRATCLPTSWDAPGDCLCSLPRSRPGRSRMSRRQRRAIREAAARPGRQP